LSTLQNNSNIIEPGGFTLNTTDKETSMETDQEDSTYFSSKRLLKICSACDAISSIFLILAVLVFVFGVWLVIQTLAASGPLERLVIQAAPLALLFGFFTMLCLFFWVFLRATSEGMFILMDIQDNTSPRHEEK
jgi:hypothetical protein